MWLPCMVWLVAPSLVVGHQEGVGSVWGGYHTKVPGTDASCWKLICTGFTHVFEKPGTLSEKAIKYNIDLLLDSIPSAKRSYRISPVKLAVVRKQLDKYLTKSWIIPSTSCYGALIFFARKKNETLRIYIDYRALNQQTRPKKYPLPRTNDPLD